MDFIATILLTIAIPFQVYFLPFFSSNSQSPSNKETQASHFPKEPKESFQQTFKGSLKKENFSKSDNFGGTGLIPQRKKDYRDIKIFASSSVVIDVDTGTILHYDNGRLRIPIASLTKIMTAVLVIEKIKNLDDPVIIDKEAILADGTKVGCPRSGYCIDERLHEGEKLTAKDLLMAMLMNSANDAAIALGKHISGSQKSFSDLMNAKAKELDLGDSLFCNPSGLDEDNCYSSAYDIARVAAYSMKYNLIWDIMRKPEAEIESCDRVYSHLLKNTDLFIGQMPNCLGGKTGFTYNAGKSLLTAASDPQTGRHRIIAVILNDNNRWEDMANLINWTFENYEWK